MPDDDEKNPQSGEGEDKSNRMDAAKAFFRAMYAGEEPPAQTGEASPADSRRVQELEQQLGMLEQKATEAENLYRRMAADFDNFRRRVEREREELSNAGVRKAAEAIMPALDDLDRAMMYLTPETPSDKLIESFQLVASRIMQCLEQAGLKRLNTQGGVLFDPRFHEPVQQIETEEHPDGTIVHELRGGYILGERVIRPALVNVASNNSVTVTPVPELSASQSAAATQAEKAEVKPQNSSVATACEEKETQSQGKKEETRATEHGEPEDGSRVFDLGDMDDLG